MADLPFTSARVQALHDAWVTSAAGWGEGSAPRRRGGRIERVWSAGSDRLAVSVYAFPTSTASHGLQVTTQRTQGERSAELYFSVDGGKTTADALRVTLTPAEGAPVEVGVPLTAEVGSRVVQAGTRPDLDALSATLTAVRDDFPARARVWIDELAAGIDRVLDARDFQMCDDGPDPGGGRPPPCLPRPPTDAEVAGLRARWHADLDRRRAVIDADPAGWGALVRSLVPPVP